MKIAVVTNKPYNDCETFIKAQIDKLPFEITQYWGRELPFNLSRGKSNLKTKLLKKVGAIKQESNLEVFSKHLVLHQTELVLAQYGMVGDAVYTACAQLNLPLVVHFHGHDAVRHTVLKAHNNYKQLFSYHKLTVVSVSHEMTKRLVVMGCPVDKIVYNVYGPSNMFLELKPKFSKNQFISIGRFVEKKAPHLMILAFNEVLKTHPDATLVYAGDGVLLDSCKDLAQALGIVEQVLFPGRVAPLQYQNYLCESLAYVQHSIEAQDGDMEGTPVSILEASAAGLPIISTKHAGIPDVIEDGETGLLCDEKDINTMVKHMLWVLDNKNEAQKMGRQGKSRIAENFSMAHHIENLTSIIKAATK